jgi:hypothetical protein
MNFCSDRGEKAERPGVMWQIDWQGLCGWHKTTSIDQPTIRTPPDHGMEVYGHNTVGIIQRHFVDSGIFDVSGNLYVEQVGARWGEGMATKNFETPH